jgi:cytoplasmic iron level regulating protein YaaA (DUF328/UPF0246 family)
MLLLLSPAKKLDYDSPVRTSLHSEPLFMEPASGLIDVLKKKSVSQVAALMDLSDKLALLNAGRYASWTPRSDRTSSRQAALAFNGDVYQGLDAASLSDAQLKWAQDHVVILSGLYGVLRPLDLIQPYRLEMGTRLATHKGHTLYSYWGPTIAHYLNGRLQKQRRPLVLNLASEEYFKSVDLKTLRAPVAHCIFQDFKNGTWKVISFHAKKARGLMARFVIEKRIGSVAGLKAFSAGGYAFDAGQSTDSRLVFKRS